ncbi:MAG TPA: hypothetical protein VMS31_07265 [Pyrinomonadaceae bacterium]|nr:hypothetical protein [Pyrinomonadaceae bacterium]
MTSQYLKQRATRSWRACLALVVCLVLAATPFQRLVFADEDLHLAPDFDAAQPIVADTPISFICNRELGEGEGRIAIVIARVDVTSLLVETGKRLTYVPTLMPLPLGSSEVVTHQVGVNGEWRELARFTLQVVKEKPAAALTAAVSQSPPEAAEEPARNPVVIPTSAAETTGIRNGATTPAQAAQAAQADGTPLAPAANGDSHNVAAGAPVATPATQGATEKKKMKFTPSVTIAVKSQIQFSRGHPSN